LILLYFGTWGSEKKLKPLQLTNNKCDTENSKFTTIHGTDTDAELWVGIPSPKSNITEGTNILLSIALQHMVGSFPGILQTTVAVSENLQSLIVKIRIPKTNQDHYILEFISRLNKLQKHQISSEHLRRALNQWKSENNALTLHPKKLLHQVAIGRTSKEFIQSVELVTVDDINRAIKEWIIPERISILSLGVNTLKQQDIDNTKLSCLTN